LVDMPWFMMCYGCYGIWLVIWFYYVEEFGMYISLGQRRSHEVSVLAWLERKSELPGSKLPSKGLHGLKGRKFKSYTIHPWVGLHGYIRMTFWYVLVLSWHLSPDLAVCFAVIATKFTIWLQVFLGMPGCRHCFFAQQISRETCVAKPISLRWNFHGMVLNYVLIPQNPDYWNVSCFSFFKASLRNSPLLRQPPRCTDL
jgi:hypothetical protein